MNIRERSISRQLIQEKVGAHKLSRGQPFINLKEKLNARPFNNPSTIDANFGRSSEKASNRRKDESDNGTRGRYDTYIYLNTFKENIYQECANVNFQKTGIISLFPLWRTSRTDNAKYYHFHKGHNHTFNKGIQLNDCIKVR